MFRFATLVFLALVSSTLASPMAVPDQGAHTAQLEKRSMTGRGTWFGVGLGACGQWNKNSDKIIAISASIYNNGAHCNQQVNIQHVGSGKIVTALVRDECLSCGPNDIDMSPSLFQELEDLGAGLIPVTWSFVSNKKHKN